MNKNQIKVKWITQHRLVVKEGRKLHWEKREYPLYDTDSIVYHSRFRAWIHRILKKYANEDPF